MLSSPSAGAITRNPVLAIGRLGSNSTLTASVSVLVGWASYGLSET
jgi:hypothetical protein